jgi:diguanylate cyclase (GGDEF)-like protein/PAS domain S-box-containing protein
MSELGETGMVLQQTSLDERVGIAAYRVMFETYPHGAMFGTSDDTILAANPRACEMLAMSEAEICRRGRSGIVDLEDPRWAIGTAERERTGHAVGVGRMRRGDGRMIDLEVTTQVFPDDEGHYAFLRFSILRDVTGQHATERALEELQARLHELTLTDELTGLRNRRGVESAGQHLLELADRQGVPVQVLLLEVHNLVTLNAELGHHGGDAGLQAVARALTVAFRKTDVLGRVTGTHFLVLSYDLHEVGRAAVARRIRRHLSDEGTTALVGREVEVALGWMSRRPGDSSTIEDLAAKADWAMRESVEATLAVGRSHWQDRTPLRRSVPPA